MQEQVPADALQPADDAMRIGRPQIVSGHANMLCSRALATQLAAAAHACKDLRFVAAIADVLAVLRRPFDIGSAAVVAGVVAHAELAAFSAAQHLQARVQKIPSGTGSHAAEAAVLQAVLQAATEEAAVVVLVDDRAWEQPAVLAMLKSLIRRDSLAGFVTPAQLLDLYQGDPEALVACGAVLCPGVDFALVRFTPVCHGSAVCSQMCYVLASSRNCTHVQPCTRLATKNCMQLYPHLGLTPRPTSGESNNQDTSSRAAAVCTSHNKVFIDGQFHRRVVLCFGKTVTQLPYGNPRPGGAYAGSYHPEGSYTPRTCTQTCRLQWHQQPHTPVCY